MADITITSLRGGLNNTDASVTLPHDQCVIAENVEFDTHPLGSRRQGCVPITHPDLGDKVVFLFRHLPTIDLTEAQLWVLGVEGASTPILKYKDTSWHDVTPDDPIDVTSNRGYELDAVTLHSKLFVAYKSGVNRLHVWDGASLRPTGLAEPAAPSVADTGAGTYIGTRYFCVCYKSEGTSIRRSEPSDVTTFVPSGTGLSARITRPASIGEGETHWEIEGSTDNNLFYRLATVIVATTTYDDSVDYVSGYANAAGTILSEDIGDYTPLHSAKFVVADDDRLILGSSWEDEGLSSRIAWTPVFNDPGNGNDERSPIDTDNFKDLNVSEGGELTGLSRTVNGYLYAFKYTHIYQLTRSGLRTRAYDSHALSKVRGAVKGSIVEGIDQQGRPCLYFIDPNIGPCRIGDGGVQTCSLDIQETWKTVNVDGIVVTRALFYPNQGKTQQVHWWIATGESTTPNLRIMLQTNETQQAVDGVRRGWTTHNGFSSEAVCACLFSENIDDDTARSLVLRPFIGMLDGTIQRCDTGDDDAGQAYHARIVTAPFISKGILNKFGVRVAALVAKAAVGVDVIITAIRNFGQEEMEVTIDLSPDGVEDPVIKSIDNFGFSDLHALQIEFNDTATPAGIWDLDLFAMTDSDEETP